MPRVCSHRCCVRDGQHKTPHDRGRAYTETLRVGRVPVLRPAIIAIPSIVTLISLWPRITAAHPILSGWLSLWSKRTVQHGPGSSPYARTLFLPRDPPLPEPQPEELPQAAHAVLLVPGPHSLRAICGIEYPLHHGRIVLSGGILPACSRRSRSSRQGCVGGCRRRSRTGRAGSCSL